MNPIDHTRDEDRDAWLAQALRHAPDANTDAPAALSDTILREARAAARPPAARPRPDPVGTQSWIAAAWDWLARPPVAAGFASLMVATLVGVMWWDKPLDESLPSAPERVASTPQAPAEAAPPAVVAAAPAAPEERATPAEPAAPKPAPASRESTAQGRLADKKDAEKKEAETGVRASRPADEPTRQRGAADAAPAVAAAAPPPAPFPAAPRVLAPQAATTANDTQAPLEERRALAAPAAKAAAESSGEVAADKATPSRNDLRALQGSASPALAKARTADAGEAPLATLQAQIAQQPERWRWQRGPGAPQPMNAAVQGWLAELDRQTAARWQTGADSTARAPAGSLRLFRDSALQATLGFTSSAVWIETPGAALAPLPESVAESLRKALDEATP
jgi:hypothetical protein